MKVKQTLTKKQKKIKFNSVIASIIWGAMVLTGCPQPNGPTPEPTPVPVYPETLTQDEKDLIASLNGDTYSALLANIDTILTIENLPEEYKTKLSAIRVKLGSDSVSFLAESINGNEFTDDLLENKSSSIVNFDNMDLEDKKEDNDNYTNYDKYEEKYTAYENAVNAFNALNDYYKANTENYADNFTDYENKYNFYKELVENSKVDTSSYNNLIGFMKDIRDDFKDNYLLDNENNLSLYTEDYAESLYNSALAEEAVNQQNNKGLATAKENYENAKFPIEVANNTIDNNNPSSYKDAAESAKTALDSVELKSNTTFTYTDIAEVTDGMYAKDAKITISIPATENEEPTTVNIAKLYEQYTAISSQVGENGSVSISYANAANTTIEGQDFAGLDMDLAKNPENASKFNSFFNAIAPENATAESLPSITATIGVTGNLYGTGIDKFIEKYYDLGVADKLQGINIIGSAEFDAIDHLNNKGGVVYDNNGDYIKHSEDSNDGNYYNLDVNAALLMNANLKNVNVTGAVSGEKNTFEGTFTNVRFGEDTTGFTFSDSAAGIGLIEFAGDAPSVTPSVKSGRLVLHNVDSEIAIYGGFSIDVSKVSEDAISNYVNKSSATFIEAFYPTEESAKSSKFTPDSLYINGVLTQGSENYKATNQQWVEAGITGEFSSYPESDRSYPSSISNLSAKAKLDEKNNTLLNTILFNNQKVYG